MKMYKLKDPVFVIGAGRSGTTVFFDCFSRHSEFGFFTNYDDILSSTPLIGLAKRLVDDYADGQFGRRKDYIGKYDFGSLRPRKTEAYRFWLKYAGNDFGRSYLWTKRPSVSEAQEVKRKIDALCVRQKKERFVAKLTGPGRIGFLRNIFPGAKFIHVVRDPYAQIDSTLNVGFWREGNGLEELWWNDDLPPFMSKKLYLVDKIKDPIALAAMQWRSVVDSIRKEAQLELKESEFKEVSYEEFIEEPISVIKNLWDWLELTQDSSSESRIAEVPVYRNNNKKWLKSFSEKELETIRYWLEC